MAKHEPNSNEVISQITSELPYFGVKLLGPHIIKSDVNFKIEKTLPHYLLWRAFQKCPDARPPSLEE